MLARRRTLDLSHAPIDRDREPKPTEAQRLLTVDDLLAWPGDEPGELIDGEIVQRPVGRYRTLFTAEGPDETSVRVRIHPFEAIEIDLGILFGAVA